MRGVAESHEVAHSLGVKITFVFAITWAIAGVVAALGTSFMGDKVALIVHELPGMALRAFPAVLLGGLDSVPGVLVGGLIVGVLENVSNAYIGVAFGDLTPWIIMMIVIIIRPEGLWGLKRIERI